MQASYSSFTGFSPAVFLSARHISFLHKINKVDRLNKHPCLMDILLAVLSPTSSTSHCILRNLHIYNKDASKGRKKKEWR
jgi:hypothetical protein